MVQIAESFDVPACLARLAGHLRECSRRYPKAWRQIDQLRDGRQALGDWPQWCFCPMSGAYAVVSQQHGIDELPPPTLAGPAPIEDVARVGSLAAWRVSQGVYRIDPTVLDAVMDTPMDGAIPVEILMGLPEWCVYVPLPGARYVVRGHAATGFFASLEHDTHDGRAELRLLVDYGVEPHFEVLIPEVLHLHLGRTFAENYEAMIAENRRMAMIKGGVTGPALEELEASLRGDSRERIGPLLSILLYLCSQTAEYRAAGEHQPGKPAHPAPTKIKHGWRLFPPDRPKVWYVGETIGATVRRAMAQHREHDGDRLGPRPHVRRAHWHSFWTGPRADPALRKLVLRWLPPMPIAMEEDTPAARMRRDTLKPIEDLDRDIATLKADLEARHDHDRADDPEA